jgi:hypothetical protein
MAIMTLRCIVGAVLGAVWLSRSRSRSWYWDAEGTGKLFPSTTALPFWATVVSLTIFYALMCLPNPSFTLFCAVQVASEGACSD